MLEYVRAFARDELDLALVDPDTLVTRSLEHHNIDIACYLNVYVYLVRLLIHEIFYYKLYALKKFYYIIKKVI